LEKIVYPTMVNGKGPISILKNQRNQKRQFYLMSDKEREMKKYSWLFALFVVASMILAACAGGAATTAPPEPQQAQPTQAPPTQAPPPTTEAPMATEEPTATEAPMTTEAPAGSMPDLGGKTITVAVENAYPPFNSIDQATGKGVGWDYDAVTEICKRLNCVPDFKEAAWDGIFPAMQAGEFDMLADGVTITDERAKIVDFSEPYVNVIQMLLVRADETRTLDQLKSDPKALVSTQIGTTNEIVAKKNFPAERVKSFEDFGAAVLAVISGDVDGCVIDNVSAQGFMKENEGKLKIAGELASEEQLGFVFPPQSSLRDAVNAALDSMKADGTLDQINKNWGLIQ
jgi:polar amino acid transport system substrate-binding protein